MTEAQLRAILDGLPPGGSHEVSDNVALARALGFEAMTKKAIRKAEEIAAEYSCMFFIPEFTRELPHFDKAYEEGHL